VTHKPEDEFTIATAEADVWVVSPEGEEHEASGGALTASGGGTKLELKHEGFVEIDDRISHEDNWKGRLALLERFLA
jgi:hypothetical protein